MPNISVQKYIFDRPLPRYPLVDMFIVLDVFYIPDLLCKQFCIADFCYI